MTGTRSIRYRTLGCLFLVVHSRDEASDPEWDAYMLDLRQHRQRVGDSFQMMVYALGGQPTASQRARLTRALDGQAVPLAVLSESIKVRGVVTALSWFNARIRFFKPGQFDDAVRFLPAPLDPDAVRSAVRSLCQELNVDRSSWL